MTMISAIACLAALAIGIACLCSAPASPRSRSRDLTRRLRHVARHPEQVNAGDVERLLVAHDVSRDEARLVVGKAADGVIDPLTMLTWIQQYDARSLSVVVAAGLSHLDILEHLTHSTVPDLRELALFASLNGAPEVALAVRTPAGATVVAAPSVTLTGRCSVAVPIPKAFPEIYEPGAWPRFEDLLGEELLAGDILREDLDWHMAELDGDDLAA